MESHLNINVRGGSIRFFRCGTIDVVSIRATLDKSVSALSVAFRLSVSFSQIELVNREQMD